MAEDPEAVNVLLASVSLTIAVGATLVVFFNLNTMSFQKTSGLDRMRNAISIGMPLSKKVSVDVGYLNQHGFVRNGPDTSDHVLTLGLTASL